MSLTAANEETIPEFTRCLESFAVVQAGNSREAKDSKKPSSGRGEGYRQTRRQRDGMLSLRESGA